MASPTLHLGSAERSEFLNTDKKHVYVLRFPEIKIVGISWFTIVIRLFTFSSQFHFLKKNPANFYSPVIP